MTIKINSLRCPCEHKQPKFVVDFCAMCSRTTTTDHTRPHTTKEPEREAFTMARQAEEHYARNFLPEGAPTLGDILARIEAHEDLSERSRSELRSAVKCMGEAIGGPGWEGIAADPARLRRKIDKLTARALGPTDPTWANRKSLFRKALQIADITRAQFSVVLNGRWAELWTEVLASKDAGLKAGLSRFPRFCQKKQIQPENVTSATIALYRESLSGADISGDPYKKAACAAQAWNRARTRIPGWPQSRINAENRSNTYSLGWETFPALERDVDEWLTVSGGDDLFADDAPVKPLRDSTKQGTKGTMLRIASAAAHAGVEPALLTSLSALVQIDVVKKALTWVHDERLGRKRTGALANMASALRNAARYHVKVGAEHLEALRRIVSQARPDDTGTMTEKNRAALEPFKDIGTLIELVRLPGALIDAAAKAKSDKARATRYETALAIALLTFCPVRSENLLGIDLDRHILRMGRGRSARTVLSIAVEEVKNRQDLAFDLPGALVAMIDEFVSTHRPNLASEANRHLFSGRTRSGALDRSALSKRIERAMLRHVGYRLTLHQFRHLAVLIYGRFHQNDFEAMRLLLGHKSTSTAIKYYAMINTETVHRAYGSILKSIAAGRDD